jgi:hypothetical protein
MISLTVVDAITGCREWILVVRKDGINRRDRIARTKLERVRGLRVTLLQELQRTAHVADREAMVDEL